MDFLEHICSMLKCFISVGEPHADPEHEPCDAGEDGGEGSAGTLYYAYMPESGDMGGNRDRGCEEAGGGPEEDPGGDLAGKALIRTLSNEELISAMVSYSPDLSTTRFIVRELARISRKALLTVHRHGVNIVILPTECSPYKVDIDGKVLLAPHVTYKGRSYEDLSFFSSDHRVILLRESWAAYASIHEFAHAFDHAYSARNRLPQQLSLSLWIRFSSSRRGFVSSYAGTNHQEYFAESFAAFYDLFQREELRKLDPAMERFLSELLEDE
ncbi:MAG: hypothetical protein RDV48_26740 [Candidatus Eremiobacteraeota bacterium]|nr:hypothetical protein [Candidatus Eremiobacteraeota bacterium]